MASRSLIEALFAWKPELRLLTARGRRARREELESDHGRRYGWFVERGTTRIAELDYIRWDSYGQFWHEYAVRNLKIEPLPETDDDWLRQKIVLRNRRYPDVVVSEFLTSLKANGRIIAIRFARVPLERFEGTDNLSYAEKTPQSSKTE